MLLVRFVSSCLVILCLLLSSCSYNEHQLEAEECRDRGEAFSGAWLSTVEHVLRAPMMGHYLKHYVAMFIKGKKRFACEEASYFVFHKMRKNKTKVAGELLFGEYPQQTIDILDFAVLHLSVAERLLTRSPPLRHLMKDTIGTQLATLERYFSAKMRRFHQKMAGILPGAGGGSSEDTSAALRFNANNYKRQVHARKALRETLVVIPVILNVKADGNSEVEFRRRYLELTLRSLEPFFDYVAVFVMSAEEAMELASAKLPIWEVVHVENLAQSCSLPAAAMVEAARRLDGEVFNQYVSYQVVRSFFYVLLVCFQKAWKIFKYVYFTEADQILLVRDFHSLFDWANRNPYSALTPHRLVVTPPAYLRTQNKSGVCSP